MEDEEDNNETQKPQSIGNVDDVEKTRQLEKLNEYVKQMAYTPSKPPQASERTETLSKPKKKYIVGTYADHKDNLKPKERSERVRGTVEKYKPILAEQLEDFIRKYRKKQAQYEKDKKQQQINYHETLLKLQKQCEQQLMSAVVQKFAKVVAKRASLMPPSNVETESYQRLQNSLVCYILLELKVPNCQHPHDYIIYKKIAAVLADMILQALFLAHNDGDDDTDRNQTQTHKIAEMDNDIKIRALRAAKKKLHHQKKKILVLSDLLNK